MICSQAGTICSQARFVRRHELLLDRVIGTADDGGFPRDPSALEGSSLALGDVQVRRHARPTREGYRVVSRPRRTPRGACLGAAKRQEISLPGH